MSGKVLITEEQELAINEHLEGMGIDGIINHIVELKHKLYDEHSITTPSLSLLSKMEWSDLIYALHGEYEVQRFQVGDKVMVKWTNRNEERLYVITKLEQNRIHLDSEEYGDDYAPRSIVRHLTREEAFWADLGRKIGEFRIGDVYVNKQAYINESEDDGDIETFSNWYRDGNFLGLYPAESFKKFNK